MALGKNLKKQKLIPDKVTKTSSKKKATSKAKTVAKPKVKKTTSKAIKKKVIPIPKKVAKSAPLEKQNEIVSYITKVKKEKRTALREQFNKEIAELQDKTLQFVIFSMDGEDYAIEIEHVKEVVIAPEMTKVPKTPAYIQGISTIRGQDYTGFELMPQIWISFSRKIRFYNGA